MPPENITDLRQENSLYKSYDLSHEVLGMASDGFCAATATTAKSVSREMRSERIRPLISAEECNLNPLAENLKRMLTLHAYYS